MRYLAGCAAMVVALALGAEAAAAKEVVSAKVCGASDCREIDDRASLIALQEGGTPTSGPEKGSDWYTADLVVRAEDQRVTFAITLVPRAGLIRGEDGTWMPVSGQAVRAFDAMTRGLEPFPAAKLEGVVPPEPASAAASGPGSPDGSAASGDDGGSALSWIVGGGAALALGLLALLGIRRRRAGYATS